MYTFNLNNFIIIPSRWIILPSILYIYLHTLQSLKSHKFHYKYIVCAIKDDVWAFFFWAVAKVMVMLRKIAFFARRERGSVFSCVECCFTTVMAASARGSWLRGKADDRTSRLTSLWGSPPLFWSRRHSTPFSCPSGRCLRPTARARGGRRRLAGDSVSWPSPVESRAKNCETHRQKAARLCGTLSLGWGKSSYKNKTPPKKDEKKMSKMFNKFVWSQLKYWKVQCAVFLWNFMKRNKNHRHQKMSTVKSSIDDEPQREPDAQLDKRGAK